MSEIHAAEAMPASLAGVAALLAEVFPKAKRLDSAWLTWSYLGNPLGPSLSATAVAQGRVVAHLGARWLEARLPGATPRARGVLIHHAATATEFRGRGLLVAAIEAVVARAAAAGAAFAVAVLNGNSFHAFVRRAGFAALGPLSVRIGLGSPPARDPAVERPAFEPLHEPAWLAWRLAAPGSPYRLRRGGARSELWDASGSSGIPVLLAEEAGSAAGLSLPAFAPRTPLRAVVGLDPARRFRRTAYVELPLRLRPSPLQLVFRPLASGVVPPAREAVRFEAIDFDAW